MNATCFNRSLRVIILVAFLAGCGGSQPPIGAPGAMPQSHALAARANRANYKVVYSFSGSPDGQNPEASLVDLHGALYGTTSGGGSSGSGAVYRITTSGAEKVLYSFAGGSDGSHPLSALVNVNGALYGTTELGGTGTCKVEGRENGCGTAYSVTTTGTEQVLHTFTGNADGELPKASLIDVNGTLYGTTLFGGKYGHRHHHGIGDGTVFSISATGTEHVLHSFGHASDGDHPGASLIDVNGTLYGTTVSGGYYGVGTVFSVTTSDKEKVLHSFAGYQDGANPSALVDVNGALYGTTQGGGGAYHSGTVFSISTSGSLKVLYRFAGGSDGAYPSAPLIDVNGTLYGTTQLGGAGSCYSGQGCGTVYSISKAGKENVLYRFAGTSDGADPETALLDVNGRLYGTTTAGGNYNSGTVFVLIP